MLHPRLPSPIPPSSREIPARAPEEGRARAFLPVFAAIALVASAGCGRVPTKQLMPTPNLFAMDAGLVENPEDPFADTPEVHRVPEVDLLYATDRAPEVRDDGTWRETYGSGRSRSLEFGSAIVRIGRKATWERIARNSRLRDRDVSLPLQVESFRPRGRFPETPLRKVDDGSGEGGVIPDPVQVQAERDADRSLRKEVLARLALAPRKDVFLYVHGFNSDLDGAAATMAEMWHFLGRAGVPAVYSWPAGRGGLTGYFFDRESGEFTIYHLKQFLKSVAGAIREEAEARAAAGGPDAAAPAGRIHVLAHSRGTDVTMSALRELHIEALAAGTDLRHRYRIGNLILAAPDLDVEVAMQRIAAEGLIQAPERLTIYVSEGDKAIAIAKRLFGSFQRLGQLRPWDLTPLWEGSKSTATIPGVAFVDANVSAGFIGHSYFHSHPAVSSDLILVLRDDLDPGVENGRPLAPPVKPPEKKGGRAGVKAGAPDVADPPENPNFWSINDSYPSKDPTLRMKLRKMLELPPWLDLDGDPTTDPMIRER